ncbi:MAG: M20/M25/M40 family metallo-hydrolase [Pseudomonadota bacterium]
MHEDVDIVALALDLMRIPSPTGTEDAAASFIERWALQRGVGVRAIPVDGERRDLLLCGARPPRVLLTTHLDTVPGGPAPRLDGERLRGRGACDAKGIAAAMLGALLDLHASGRDDVAVLLVVGEETNSDGARAAARVLDPVEFLINGEPTDLRFVRAQRGALAFSLTCTGRACHSGYPELGLSALHSLLDTLDRLRAEHWPRDANIGDTLLNVGTLHGGDAPNVLAPLARAEIMMRIATRVDEVEARVRSLLGPDVEMDLRTRSDPQHLVVPQGRPECVVGFASDVAHLRPLGSPLMVGPGSIHVAHTDDEQVAVADLHQARQLYRGLCVDLLDGKVPHDPG